MGKWEDECFLRFKRESNMHVYQKNDNIDTTVTFTFKRWINGIHWRIELKERNTILSRSLLALNSRYTNLQFVGEYYFI